MENLLSKLNLSSRRAKTVKIDLDDQDEEAEEHDVFEDASMSSEGKRWKKIE